jgi:hypothetical protein
MKNDVYVEDVYHQPHLREQLMLLAEPSASAACPVSVDNNWLGESKLLTQYPEETDSFITDAHSTTTFELRPVTTTPTLHQYGENSEDIVTIEDCSDED